MSQHIALCFFNVMCVVKVSRMQMQYRQSKLANLAAFYLLFVVLMHTFKKT